MEAFLVILLLAYLLLPLVNFIRHCTFQNELEELRKQIYRIKTPNDLSTNFTLKPPPSTPPQLEPSKTETLPEDMKASTISEAPSITQHVSPPLQQVSTVTETPANEEGPSQFQQLFNWFIYGKATPPERQIEIAIASNWLLRIGLLLTILGVAYFFKYSIDQGWVSPQTRLISASLLALALIGSGTRFTKGKYSLLAYASMGLGLCIFYITLFAGHHLYENLIPFSLALIGTCTTTLLAVFLAQIYKSQFLVILGLSGGMLTPLLLDHPGLHTHHQLFYYNIMALGIVYLSYKNIWRVTHFASIITLWIANAYIIYEHRHDEHHLIFCLIALTALVLTFKFSTLLLLIRKKLKTSSLDLGSMAINTSSYFICAYYILQSSVERPWIAIFPLSIALFHLSLALYLSRKTSKTHELYIYHVAMIGLFTAISAPLAFSNTILTLSWSILGLTMLWISLKVENEGLKKFAYLIFAGAFLRFSLYELHSMEFPFFYAKVNSNYILSEVFSRIITHGMSIVTLLAAYLLLKKNRSNSEIIQEEEVNVFLGLFIIFGVIYSSLELNLALSHYLPKFKMGGISIYWTMIALGMIYQGIQAHLKNLRLLGLFLLTFITFKLLFVDLSVLNSFWRIIASISVGILMSFGSYLYLRFEEKLTLQN